MIVFICVLVMILLVSMFDAKEHGDKLDILKNRRK